MPPTQRRLRGTMLDVRLSEPPSAFAASLVEVKVDELASHQGAAGEESTAPNTEPMHAKFTLSPASEQL